MKIASRIIAACLALTSAPLYADEQKPAIVLTVDAKDIAVIARGLDAIPFPDAMETIIKIQAQIDQQEKQKSPKPHAR